MAGGSGQRSRKVIEVVLPSASATAHQMVARHCPVCTKRVVARPDLGGVVVAVGGDYQE